MAPHPCRLKNRPRATPRRVHVGHRPLRWRWSPTLPLQLPAHASLLRRSNLRTQRDQLDLLPPRLLGMALTCLICLLFTPCHCLPRCHQNFSPSYACKMFLSQHSGTSVKSADDFGTFSFHTRSSREPAGGSRHISSFSSAYR